MLADSAVVERGASRKAAASAAALLAIAYPGVDNAVFGLALPGGKIAFIGFRAGAPLIGFDRLVGNDVLDELTADFLKEFDEQLSGHDFFRVHHSHLVNLKDILRYQKGKGGTLTMSDGSEIAVSTRKKEEFLKRLSRL